MLLQVAKRELALECDYRWEYECQQRFKALVEADAQLRDKVRGARGSPPSVQGWPVAPGAQPAGQGQQKEEACHCSPCVSPRHAPTCPSQAPSVPRPAWARASPQVYVPAVVPELSGQRVIASEWVHGVPIDKVTWGGPLAGETLV